MTTTSAPPPATPVAPPKRRGPSRRVIVGVALGLVAAVLAVWLVAFSPVLGVRSVDVRGVHVLTAAEVRAAAHVRHGTPLLRLDTNAIARRVESLSVVKSVSVDTGYPSTVTITVVERTPVGFVQEGARFTLVDAAGVEYRTVTAHPAKLPQFVLPSGPSARSAAAGVATVAAALPAALLARVASVQALDPTSITLLLTDGRVVRWGSVARTADKAQLLPTLLRQPGTQFDVTDPDQVVVR